MMQRLVDNVLGVAKESLKTFSQESFNQTVRVINGFSALVLAVLPSQASLEGIQGWELRPKLQPPRLLSWMEVPHPPTATSALLQAPTDKLDLADDHVSIHVSLVISKPS